MEGIVTSVNPRVLKDPDRAADDPYQRGLDLRVEVSRLATNVKNLVQVQMVAPWMHHSLGRLTNLCAPRAPPLRPTAACPFPALAAQ